MKPLADRTLDLRQSDIRAVTQMINRYNGINLGQGICDLPTPNPIKHGAIEAINNNQSIYSYHSGIAGLRADTASKFTSFNNIPCDAESEVMITTGSTGAFVSACLALLNPGDEVIQFEPFYGYHVNLLKVLGFKPVFVPLEDKTWAVDFDALEKAITPKTKAIVVTTPGNPNGKVWKKDELKSLLSILQKYDLWAFTDEVYEYMTYDGNKHLSLASMDGAFERTVTISSFSKTFNMTGWRLGSAVAPAPVIEKMGLISDLIYICPATPLQHGLDEAFHMDSEYFEQMKKDYEIKRMLFCDAMEEAGFEFERPEGAYYVFAGFEGLSKKRSGMENDKAACETLIKEAGVASVPGSSFYSNPDSGRYYLRFCYAKEYDILEKACAQIRAFGGKG